MNKYKNIYLKLVERTSGPPLIFHHLPKCAGTSVYRKLLLSYILSHRVLHIAPCYRTYEQLNPDWDEEKVRWETLVFREHLLLYYMNQNIRCIAGHVRFSETAHNVFGGKYAFITTLRDPISWFISWYFYNFTAKENRWKLDSTIEQYLQTAHAQTLGSGFAHFFSGLPVEADPSTRESVDRAKKNLDKMTAVGFVDDMPAFQKQLRNKLGIKLDIRHENKARVSRDTRESVITPNIIDRIRAVNAVNLEIYDYARQRFS